MTGYGEARVENQRFRLELSVRSVNHRFLDLVVRLPDELRACESAVAGLVRGRLARGRVELRLAVEPLAEAPVELRVRDELLRQLLGRLRELRAEGLAGGEPGIGDLLRLPQVLEVRESPLDWGEAEDALLAEGVRQALEQVVLARAREGESLRRVLLERVAGLEELTEGLESRRREVARDTLASLRERITELFADAAVPEERLVQEAALLVERGDVREELDRLSAHLQHFRVLLGGDGPHGRRLEFLVQEIQRELNTLGGKCRDPDMVERVVEGKLLCDQLREQLLNVE